MKMIGHQAPGQNIDVRQKMFSKLFKEEQVVLTREEYRLRVVPAIINMVNMTFSKVHNRFFLQFTTIYSYFQEQ
jgi:hypothetical protein